MYDRRESEYYRAKLKAARRVYRGWVKPADLPSNVEIREEIQRLARLHEGEARRDTLREMRLEALRLMRVLFRYRPRLIGSVLTGHVRQGSDIDIHVFADRTDGVTSALEAEGMVYEIQRKRIVKNGEERVFTHVHIQDRYPFELTIYPRNKAHYVSKSSVTGKPIERASINELEQLLLRQSSAANLAEEMAEIEQKVDRFQVYESLLLPLENVRQSRVYHPEGDALYHSLQVFDLARDELPYDEEFMLAALLHDAGKAIDPREHVAAALEALDGFITERTAWLIENHMLARTVLDGTIGARARKRLQQAESYDELILLSRCDRDGRQPGVATSELDEALEYVRDLSLTFGE